MRTQKVGIKFKTKFDKVPRSGSLMAWRNQMANTGGVHYYDEAVAYLARFENFRGPVPSFNIELNSESCSTKRTGASLPLPSQPINV